MCGGLSLDVWVWGCHEVANLAASAAHR